jgi:site-specific DNA-methyltransferase (adenine-specific)
MALSKKQPMRNHETLSVIYQGKYNPIKEEREGFTDASIQRLKTASTITYKNHGDSTTGLNKNELNSVEALRFPTTIKKFASIPNRLGTLHPTQKPTDLLEYLIKTYSNENEIVLDNTAGSCSTAIASKNTNRRWICIEKEEKYCDISAKRIKNHNVTP